MEFFFSWLFESSTQIIFILFYETRQIPENFIKY